MNENIIYKRGDVFYANLGETVGSEQSGFRPVVIVQNDQGNKYSPTVIVAPVTSQGKRKSYVPTHSEITATWMDKHSTILLEQLRTIDKSRLGGFLGVLNREDLKEMNRALAISVGLKSPSKYKQVGDTMRMCLCGRCASDFRGTGRYRLMRIYPYQDRRDLCTYCGHRLGLDYDVVPIREEVEVPFTR